MSKNIKVELGDVDCTAFLVGAQKEESYGDSVATYELTFTKNVAGLVTLSNTLSVEVWEDDNTPPTTKKFTGFLDLLNPQGGFVEIIAKDELAKLVNKQIMHYYDSSIQGDPAHPSGRISAIFNDTVTTYGGLKTYTSFGETTGAAASKLIDSSKLFSTSITNPVTVGDIVVNLTDSTSTTVTAVDSDVQLSLDDDIMTAAEEYHIYNASGAIVADSGTDITLGNFPCRNADVFERDRKLAESLNWVFYYRADTDRAYFQPKNYTTNSNVLTVGGNVIEIPHWEYDRSEMINDLRLEGAQQLVQSSEVFSGDGSETVFELSAIPESVAIFYSAAKNYATTAKLQAEIKVGDVLNGTTVHDYEVDKKNKKIHMTSFVPADSANNILAEVSYYAPLPVHLADDASKATYNMDYEKTVPMTDAITLADAWKRGSNILEKYKVPFKSTRLKVLWTPTLDVRVGQSIRVVDTINVPNVDQFFTIYKVFDPWPQGYVEVEVGDKQYTIEEYNANIVERVKRLEETVIGATETVTEIVQQTILTPLVPDKTVVLIQDINDSFILGHADNGKIGSIKLGSRISEQSETTHTW